MGILIFNNWLNDNNFMKNWKNYAQEYVDIETDKKMTWQKAFFFTLFDSFFIGLKWAIGVMFFLLFWSFFNSQILVQFAEKVCPILK